MKTKTKDRAWEQTLKKKKVEMQRLVLEQMAECEKKTWKRNQKLALEGKQPQVGFQTKGYHVKHDAGNDSLDKNSFLQMMD